MGIGFGTSWKLTLVVASCAPLFAVALGCVIGISLTGEKRERGAYARAGGVDVVRCRQRVAAFLQPTDGAYLEVGGRPVALYDYTFVMRRVA